jgi:beta-carotene ketolase (CrtW type)
VTPARQRNIGVGLAAAVIAGWALLHVWSVFFLRFEGAALLLAPLVAAVLTWLSVGLFIVAHDAMHRSLAPDSPGLNRGVGTLCLVIYAGFWFDRLLPKHHAHHRAPGSDADPDFHADAPTRFWPWYLRFFREYFGWRELAWVATVSAVYILVLRAPLVNVWVFWAAPALLSSLQLFTFGTWLPHRHEVEGQPGFIDQHRARSNQMPRWLSLLTCFHFGGFHHEHHTHPHLPWWRLPEARSSRPA